ncbi:MAG: GDP-mannose 4,6-dehydratase [Halobacteriovoraceae bacterium]|nr:GDP-mannose 4,6-dehydratase [Halobacteriovoraceae bacterium]
MKILITGAAGFIGSHLVDSLLEESHEITGIDNFDPFYDRKIKEDNLKMALKHNSFQFKELDICNYESLLEHLNNHRYDLIIHLAARAGVRPSLKKPLDYVRTNVEGSISLLNAMMETNHRKLIFSSSSSIYGKSPEFPFQESHISQQYIFSVYAVSKQSAEAFMRLYYNLYKFSVINLRFFTVYGPRQRPDLAIHSFFKANLLKKEISLFGDGLMARDYTYIEDILQGIKGAINRIKDSKTPLCETYNLGNHNPVNLKQLITTIEDISGKKNQITYRDIPLGDVPITFADISKACEYLDYKPKTSIKEGLEKMYPWIQSLYCDKNKFF